MAGQHQSNSSAYRIVTVCTVLTIAYSILIIAVFLQLKGAVCSTTSSGVGLLIAVSLPTIAVAGIRCYLIIRQRSKSFQTISPSTASPRLDSACVAGVQVLVLLWVIIACVNLLIVVRAPLCLQQPLPQWQGNLKEQNWRYGFPCRLHRCLVALSVLMALSITCLSFSDSVNQQQTRRGVSLISCYFTFRKPAKSHHSPRSVSSSQSWSTLGKDDPLYLIPERRSSQLEHDQWQHLRNSLSSQRAIYPLRYQWHDQRPRYASSGIAPGRYSATLGSVSEGYSLEPGDRNSSMTSSQSSRAWNTIPSTRPSTIASSHSRASSNPERGDLRREKISKSPAEDAKTPDVPPLPTLPPPTWAPTLYHAPLSADPTLRALSTGSAAVVVRPNLAHSKSSPDLLVQPLKIKKRQPKAPVAFPAAPTPAPRTTKESASKTLLSTSHPAPPMPSITPPPPPTALATPLPSHPPPTLPSRAPGHSARQRLALPPQPHPHASLRRPDALRHHQHSNLSISASPSQIHLPTHQYQHQRVWKYGGHHPGSGHTGGRDMSVYSMSSHGTNPATDSRVSYARG